MFFVVKIQKQIQFNRGIFLKIYLDLKTFTTEVHSTDNHSVLASL